MVFSRIAPARLFGQRINQPGLETAKEVVSWMGAMQAQDYAMAKWAIGIRSPGSTEEAVKIEIDRGAIIRTHLLRPTWHFVSADDIYWMLKLTAPRIKAGILPRHQQLGLTEDVIQKSNAIIGKALMGGKHLSRRELVAELNQAHIGTDNNRASHIFLRAELDGLICSGAEQEGKPTYAILEERVPKTKPLSKDEALARLAKLYFSSRCPATLKDFTWWSGLTAKDASQALIVVNKDLIAEKVDSQTYWRPNDFSFPGKEEKTVFLLPPYDEFFISYANREASLPGENQINTISGNGIFRPVIVADGQVVGLWSRTIKRDRVLVESMLLTQIDEITKSLIEKAAMQLGHFLGKQPELIIRD